MTLCKYWDCGWCYAPSNVKTNSKTGWCYNQLECSEYKEENNMDFKKELYKVSASNGKVSVWSAWTEGAEVITKFGTQDGKKQQKTYTAEGKNIGRANETSAEEQALVELAAMYEAQRKNKHYRDSVEEAVALNDSCKIPRKVHNFKDHGHKIKYPCYVSVKLNGSRACVLEGSMYSKIGRAEEVKVPHIKEALDLLGNVYLDSEVYSHGLSLQRIRSAWTKPNKTEKELEKIRSFYYKSRGIKDEGQPMPYNPVADVESLKLYVFDIPKKGIKFEDRLNLMSELEWKVCEEGLEDVIKFVYPILINSEEEVMLYRDEMVSHGYEGVVVYQKDDMYEFGKRSYSCLKSKPRYDSEALVESVTSDKNGEGVLHCRTCDKLGRVKFKCKMKVSRRDGKDYPRDFETMQDLIGKWITFSYEELSDKGVPTKGVGECVRKCDDSGNPLE